MQHVISTIDIRLTGTNSYTAPKPVTISVINKFIVWCDMQESRRFLWLGIALMVGIGTVLPVTLSAITFIGGNVFALWIAACITNVPILVVNLAAQPTKVTLPVMFFAWVVDAIIITWCIVHFFIS